MEADKVLEALHNIINNPQRDSEDARAIERDLAFITEYINNHRVKSIKSHGLPKVSGHYIVYWKRSCDTQYSTELAFFDERTNVFYRQPFNSSFISPMVAFYYKVETVTGT